MVCLLFLVFWVNCGLVGMVLCVVIGSVRI